MSEIEEKITSVVDSEVRPFLESHGGGIVLGGFDEASGVLTVSLTGGCCGCPGASATIRNMVLSVIQKKVPEVKGVTRAE
ncbi:thioredoxin [Synergistales bacterium]|nr:thioredoxin [Synergistales bacterium]